MITKHYTFIARLLPQKIAMPKDLSAANCSIRDSHSIVIEKYWLV